jgi:hypothetical protein
MPSVKSYREWLPNSMGPGTSVSERPRDPAQITVMGRMTNAIAPVREAGHSAAQAAGLSPATDSAFYQCFPKLTFKERVKGCIGCFFVGMVISLLSFVSWWTGNIPLFAILYTLGNVISLTGSGFLMGPKRQFRNMTRARRRWAAGVYLGSMILTLIVAFTMNPKAGGTSLLILACVFVQWCALIWYIASYIPFGQKIITKVRIGGAAHRALPRRPLADLPRERPTLDIASPCFHTDTPAVFASFRPVL